MASANDKPLVTREEIEGAISRAVELRTIHAAFMQGNSPSAIGLSSPSSLSCQLSAQDYPTFSPQYYHEHELQSPQSLRKPDDYGHGICDAVLSYRVEDDALSPKNIFPDSTRWDEHRISGGNRELKDSVYGESIRSHPSSVADEIDKKNPNGVKDQKPDTDPAGRSWWRNRNRYSWLLPKFKRKQIHEVTLSGGEGGDHVSEDVKNLGSEPVETLRRKLIEATENQEAAWMEVGKMRSSMAELRQKLDYLENYCENLKIALKRAIRERGTQASDKHKMSHNTMRCGDKNGDNSLPLSEDLMAESFLKMVSEARLSLKQFCKTLIAEIDEEDEALVNNLNHLLQPYDLSVSSNSSMAILLYHFMAMISHSFYQNFENRVFLKNGSSKQLNEKDYRMGRFSSYMALKNLCWNEVLKKGTRHHSEEFSRFCDQKMSCIITTLNWRKPWTEQLLHAFFIAAKCTWLLHLLAFSFDPALRILRVEDDSNFDPQYMEELRVGESDANGPCRVLLMVMPGFYLRNSIVKCKVICVTK